MRIRHAPRRLGFDASTEITKQQAEYLYAAGYRVAFRYIDRVVTDPDKAPRDWPRNLTTGELATLLDAGFCVSPVQYYSTNYESIMKGKRFSRDYGAQMGDAAAENCRRLGMPQGITVWMDLEDCGDASPQMAYDYCDGFGERMVSHGYAPGLYYGSGLGSPGAGGYITGALLYSLPRYRAYWRAASAVPQIPNRGCTVVQSTEVKETVFGVRLDQDMICIDHKWRSNDDVFMVVCS